MLRRRSMALLTCVAFLPLPTGCALIEKSAPPTADLMAPLEAVDEQGEPVPPEPPAIRTGGNRALLLGTGAIQLGPGFSKNADRWAGDGQWGF